jgi:hypothetical protein
MKKCLSALAAIAMSISPLSASAAVKTGDACKKAGQTATANGKKFTCVKSGKKLVWKKGVAISAPKLAPTPTPAPTASESPAPAPTVTSAPVIEKAPTGFNDLVENFKGIYVGVWQSTESKISANPAVDVKQNILVGPNSLLLNSSVDKAFSRGTQFFAGYPQPKRFNALYYTFEDIKWAEEKIFELYKNPDERQQISRNCQSIQRCNGANAYVPQTDTGNANFGIQRNSSDDYHLKGGIEIHEYAHMVQFIQFQGKPTQRFGGGFALIPNWFVEGHAHLAGNAGSAYSLAEYKSYRSFWLNAHADGLQGYSPESIETFYEKLAPGKFDATVVSNVYSIGYFTVEALAAVKGIDSPIEIFKLVSDGFTWDEAFLKVYGVTWKEAAPILAKTVSRMFLERY